MKPWRIESVVRLTEPAKAVEALALSGDDVQVAATSERSLFIGLLGPSGFPTALLPTGITTDTNSESIDVVIRGLPETVATSELVVARQLQWTPEGTALWVAGESAVVHAGCVSPGARNERGARSELPGLVGVAGPG